MKRRNFLKSISATSPLLLGGVPVQVFADSLLNQQFSCANLSDRVLVMIQLSGGNDGLNTLVPIEQYGQYRNFRPKIGIRDSGNGAFTQLDNSLPQNKKVGIQPDFLGIKDLYDDGKLNLVMDVSYNDVNKSHFKGTDIWMAGRDASTSDDISSGWVGRYLDKRFAGYPQAYPNPDMPDPLALQLGSNAMSLAFYRQAGIPAGITLNGDPSSFYNLVTGIGGPLPGSFPNSDFGRELAFISSIEKNINVYAQRLNDIYASGANMVNYPDGYHSSGARGNELAPQLKTIARLISGGSKTKIFLTKLNKFDTHGDQTDRSDPHKGFHAVLLYHLAESLKAFQADLKALGVEDRVLTCTFSEFGRQVGENGAYGTDHGTSAPMILVGKGVKPGLTGINPDLSSENIKNNNFINYQHDYRRVFTTLLQDWLGAGPVGLDGAQFLDFQNQKLDLINDNYQDPNSGASIDFVASPDCYDQGIVTFPVELLSFQAEVQDSQLVKCSWATGAELNNELFVVERSVDRSLFESVGEVPGAGTSQTVNSYEFLDEQPVLGTSYYRLRQIDFDGSFSYSEIREVNLSLDPGLKVGLTPYPNPFQQSLNLELESNLEAKVFVRVCMPNGALISKKEMQVSVGKNEDTIDTSSWSPGLYFVEVILKKESLAERVAWSKIMKT